MKIGDRVAYADEWGEVDSTPVIGTVVEPTKEELEEGLRLDMDAHSGDVMVEWDDGERFWEIPGDLIVVDS